MTPCNVDMLSRYLDGELPLPDRHALDRHLAECEVCVANLDMLRRNDHLLRSWGRRRTRVPAALEQRIARDVGRRRRFGPLLAFSKMMPAAVGTSVAALLVLLTASLTSPYSQRAETGAASPSAAIHQTIVRQSAPLIMNRRTQAIVAGRIQQQPLVNQTRRLFDEN